MQLAVLSSFAASFYVQPAPWVAPAKWVAPAGCDSRSANPCEQCEQDNVRVGLARDSE
jgi:hypothetical protein